MNVVAHLQNHVEMEQMEMMKQMMMQGGAPPPEEKGQGSPPKAKDTENIPAPRGIANVP